jgi:catechol 2,3-dioxygenase-like lactoylglutathione lyase family enzyme
MNESTESNGAWPGAVGAITLFQEDLRAAKRFYHDVFRLPVVFEDASFRDPGGHVWEIAN